MGRRPEVMPRNVVVTGGGTGIGWAVAAGFAADGDTVVILGRRPEPLKSTATELGPAVRAVVCDATDPAQVEALRRRCRRRSTCWSTTPGATPTSTAPARDLESLAASWRANLEANLLSAVLMTAVVDRGSPTAAR